MSEYTFDVIVIGGGPAGYPAAFRAADLGLKVALIDPETNPGGVCLYRGCIPSKALLHVAELIQETKHAGSTFGVEFSAPKINLEQLRAYKNDVIAKMTRGLGTLTKTRNIQFYKGKGFFLNDHSLEIKDTENQTQEISFKNAIIATGSVPTQIPQLSLNSPRVMDSTDALALESIPKSLLCIGGGIIGMELATVYSALGSEVSIVEMLPKLLGPADLDLTKILVKTLKPSLKEIKIRTKVNSIKEIENGILVEFENESGEKSNQTYNKILVSIGRTPTTQNLGLEKVQVNLSSRGFIEVDRQCRTSVPHIFAIGDVVGQPMLAHKGTHEGHVVAEVIAGKKVEFNPKTIPSVVYTNPEVAWTGVTEAKAKEENLDYVISKFPWSASSRATTLSRNEGLTKLIFDKQTGILLGAGIVGVGAGDLIGEVTLAIEMGATAQDIALTIHPHPTTSETIMEAAELFLGHSDHYLAPKRK